MLIMSKIHKNSYQNICKIDVNCFKIHKKNLNIIETINKVKYMLKSRQVSDTQKQNVYIYKNVQKTKIHKA